MLPYVERLTGNVMIRDYSSLLLDHYNNPRNVGELDKNNKNVGTGTSGKASCGDVLRLQLLINNNTIEDVKFKTFGCGSAIASSSFLTEMIKGKTLDEVKKIKNSDIAHALSLPKVKLHCSILAEEALESAISDYMSKNNLKHHTSNNIEKEQEKMENDTKKILITDNAKDKMKNMLKDQNGKCIFISVQSGGCKGLMYNIEVSEQEKVQGDVVLEEEGLKVLVPAGIMPLIGGSIIDYFDNGMRAGFKFDNPNQSGCCGCGMSFCA